MSTKTSLRLPAPAAVNLPGAGTHPARLLGLIGLGSHESVFKDRTRRSARVLFLWELVAEQGPGGKPPVVGKDFTLSSDPKSNLTALLKNWLGEISPNLDLADLLGRDCLVSVAHEKAANSERVFARVGSVSAVPRGMTVPPLSRETLFWTVDSTEPVPSADWVPWLYGEPVKDVIARSLERGGNGRRTERNGGSGAPPDGDPGY